MTTLPERLKELASRMNQDGDKYDAFTLLAEAVQALQAQEVVKETTINHARDPHCCGCYVIRWNDGDPVAVCGECGVQVALLDRIVSGAPEGGDTMRGVCESADFEADTLTFRMVGAYYAAAGEYVITPAAPSPTAALQAGVGRFVACRCVSERDRELCMTKDECSKVYAYSDTAPKEPTK